MLAGTLTKKAVGLRRSASGREGGGGRSSCTAARLAAHADLPRQPDWQGKSGLNPYADFVMATDAAVGEVLDGPRPPRPGGGHAGDLHQRQRLLAAGRLPGAAEARATTRATSSAATRPTSTRAGHRVPFFVRWPGQVVPGAKSDSIVCLTDICWRRARRSSARSCRTTRARTA